MKSIFLSAYSCNPDEGSESAVGWSWLFYYLINTDYKIYLVTRTNNLNAVKSQKIIEKYLDSRLILIPLDLPQIFLKIKNLNKFLNAIYYYLWQIQAGLICKKICSSTKVHYSHHITYVTLHFPTFLWFSKSDIILGPLAGGDKVPVNLRKSFSLTFRMREKIRDILGALNKYNPLMNLMYSNAKLIFVNSAESKKLIPEKFWHKVKIELSISIDDEKFQNLSAFEPKERFKKDNAFKIVYAGRLDELKGIEPLIRSFKIQKNRNATLDIIGDGYQKEKILKLILDENLTSRIKVFGWMSQEKLMRKMHEYDLFIFPSLRDSGGMVVLEALSSGVPVIAANIGGPATILEKKPELLLNDFSSLDKFIHNIALKVDEMAIDNKKIENLRKDTVERFISSRHLNKLHKHILDEIKKT